MSAYTSEYTMSSNNSINENIYNTQKLKRSPSYRLKKMLKPLLKMLLQKTKKSNKHLCKCRNSSIDSYDYASEIDDNNANETLETRIHDEIRDSEEDSAVYVYGEEHQLMKVNSQQTFIPVHFARTEAGTFFWTTFEDKSSIMESQLPQLNGHQFDRWIQA